MADIHILRADFHGEWNYIIKPRRQRSDRVPITPVSPVASSKRDDGSGMAAVGGPTGGPPGNWSPVTVYVKD